MKIVIPLFFGLAMAVSGVSMSQTENAPYVSQLKSLTEKCNVIALGAATDYINARAFRTMPGSGTNIDDPVLKQTMAEGTGKISTCLSDAREKGVGAFKQYSKNKSSTIVQDMKEVLIAWLPYVRASAIQTRLTALGDGDNSSVGIAKAAYDKAVATLQVDRLTN